MHKKLLSPMLLGLVTAGLLAGTLGRVTAQEAAGQDPWAGQRVVNIKQEPRHRTVHRDGDILLLDVQINPGDTTLPHTHDSAIMYTFISNGEGPLNGRVSANTDYVKENFTHQVSNEGPGLFRIIALANYGPGQTALTMGRPSGLSGEPQLENEWFRSYRVELAPGASTPLHTHGNPSVVVQVSDGLAHVTREDGITAELDAMGDWAWRDANSAFAVKNMGSTPVSVVINEARR
jgi:quercetin dioxygenase-like cupin family protein